MITLNQFNRVRDAARRNIQLKPRLWKTETTPEYEGHSNISLVHTKRKYLLNISFDAVQLSFITWLFENIIDL